MTEPIYDGRKELPWCGEGGGLYFRTFGPLYAGYVHDGHKHYQDHWTILLSGKIRVRYTTNQEIKTAVFIAPYKFVVKKDIYHKIEVLENNTSWTCMFVVPEEVNTPGQVYHQEVPEHINKGLE